MKMRRHISYGTGFRVACRLKTWKERSFLEKLLFWKKYKEPVNLVTDRTLRDLCQKIPIPLRGGKELSEEFFKSIEDNK